MAQACSIKILGQLREARPLEALQELAVPLSCGQDPPPVGLGAVEFTQRSLLHFMHMAHSDSEQNQRTVRDKMSFTLAKTLLTEHGTTRNRHIFLVAVLCADARSAEALGDGGVVEALCALLDQVEGEKISENERHWVLVALAELSTHPSIAGAVLRHGLARLRDLLHGVVEKLKEAAPGVATRASSVGTSSVECSAVATTAEPMTERETASAVTCVDAVCSPGATSGVAVGNNLLNPTGQPSQSLQLSQVSGAEMLQGKAAERVRGCSFSSSSPHARLKGEQTDMKPLVGVGYAAGTFCCRNLALCRVIERFASYAAP